MLISLSITRLMQMDQINGAVVASHDVFLKRSSTSLEIPSVRCMPTETVEQALNRLAKSLGCILTKNGTTYIESFVAENGTTLLFHSYVPPGPPLKGENFIWEDTGTALFKMKKQEVEKLSSVRAFLQEQLIRSKR